MNGLPNILILKQNPIFEPVPGFNVYYFTNNDLNKLPEYLHSMEFDLVVATNERTIQKFINVTVLVKEEDLIDLQKLYEFYIKTKIERSAKPVVSIFTPLYNTGELLNETYKGLYDQTYKNWEWVVIDDSTDVNTWKIASEIADKDTRVKLFKQSKRSGNIGYLKNKAAFLCEGDILVELDHDDILTDDALEIIIKAFEKHSDCDYLYSDSVELMEDGSSYMYPPGFGMWSGVYDDFVYQERLYKSTNVPINCWTIRHNVGLPNHVRAWRKEFYQRIGGHRYLPVGDDHELSVRCFLNTKIIHVNRCLYFQRVFNNGSNTTQTRNAEIQRVSYNMFQYYKYQTASRIFELGHRDYCWDDINKTYNIDNPPEKIEDYCEIFSG